MGGCDLNYNFTCTWKLVKFLAANHQAAGRPARVSHEAEQLQKARCLFALTMPDDLVANRVRPLRREEDGPPPYHRHPGQLSTSDARNADSATSPRAENSLAPV